jgi:bifunctional UDP-N-acetylglucosamine pyrophosphorylase/glucosamine-1-phosphate N-acetyltransferase
MNSLLPKPLHKVAGKTLLNWLEDTLINASIKKKIFVLGHQNEILKEYIKGSEYVIQEPQLGTGHAVKLTKEKFTDLNSLIIVAYADTPFISSDTIKKMVSQIKNGYKISILGFETDEPSGYGRIITNNNNQVSKIVEEYDADEEVKKITLCNSGVLVGKAVDIFMYLDQVKLSNNGEYYLTDIISICASQGSKVGYVQSLEEELIGINDRIDQSDAETIIQNKLIKKHLLNGVTLLNPRSIYFDATAEISKDVTIEPNVFIGPNVRIKSQTVIRAFSYLENCSIGEECSIGPYARIRPETEIKNNVRIGNFVEVKKSTISEGSKVNHLSYIGDTSIGLNSNIGAGTITCNYDGINKNKTTIGNNVFIGSNTALIAPVNIKDGSIVGAGSTITKDVDENSIAVERSNQKQFRKRRTK